MCPARPPPAAVADEPVYIGRTRTAPALLPLRAAETPSDDRDDRTPLDGLERRNKRLMAAQRPAD